MLSQKYVNGKFSTHRYDIPSGLMDEVTKVTPEEEARYTNIDFDVEDYRKDLGHSKLIHNKDKVSSITEY